MTTTTTTGATTPARMEIAALVARQRTQLTAELESIRTDLPLLDPDRHALDTVADAAFAGMAAAHPEACHGAADYPNWTPGGAR